MLPRKRICCAGIFWLLSTFLPLLFGQTDETVDLDTMEIVADRAFEQLLGIPAVDIIGGFDTTLTLDEALRKLSSVDTYRSLNSYTAHPPTQGVRFRHTATNATSRALVMVDGVPQNDPFGGWIYWNKMPMESMHSLEVFPIGSVPSWGNYSSGGAIHLTSLSPFVDRTRFSVQGGSFGTVKAGLLHTAQLSDTMGVSVEGRLFSTDGYKIVRPDQQGPIDKRARTDYEFLKLQLAQQINHEWSWALAGQYYNEDRINGTELTPHTTDSTDLSWSLERNSETGADFNFVAFYQDRDFKNVFASYDAERETGRPVLDQYSVPAEALGAQATWYWEGNDYFNFLAGADFRDVEGSSNELFRNLGAGFTRDRQEGGEQAFHGAFFTMQTLPDEYSSLEGTIRWDHWEQSEGYRREFNLETGAQSRDSVYPYRSGDVPSFNLRYSRELDANWSTGGLLFRGFRAPTLNELYRPFRVRNDITESNPDLVNEISTGGELNLRYQDEANTFHLTGFYYSLDDMITNVFLHDNTGFDALCGFVPGGGSCSQRLNVEENRVHGAEIAWEWISANDVELVLNYTYSHTQFRKSSSQPLLEGNSFPLAPRHKLTSQLLWHSSEDLDLLAQFHYRSSHFDNVLNTRQIGSSFLMNLGAHYQVPDSPWSVRLQVDNVFDEEVITAISSSGIYTRGAPLNAWISLAYRR